MCIRDRPKAELAKIISELEKQMKQAAQQLEFERAAVLILGAAIAARVSSTAFRP